MQDFCGCDGHQATEEQDLSLKVSQKETKCGKYLRKRSPSIQPLSDGIPTAPGGQSVINCAFIFLRLNRNIGG